MKNRYKKAIQVISLALCTILILVTVAPNAHATGKNNQNNEETREENRILPGENSCAGEGKTEKDETVYIFTDANGSVNKIIVSDWLKNSDSFKTIDDYSDLRDIENLKGYETFKTAANDEKKWDAEGNDIYYQGTSDKPLPIDMKITYRLDGKEISANDIKGKSGLVKIRFDFTNNEYEMCEINGEDVKIYVPFTVITGMILNNDTFKNVEVTNGRLVNDGDKTIVIGTTFPGLQEDLNIDKEKFEFPEYFEIVADVTDFEMTSTMTLATNEFVNDFDREKLEENEFDFSQIDELKDGMDKLINGSDDLHDGLSTLLESCNTLKSGMDDLTDGCNKIKNGANDLNNGVSSLQSGAANLQSGLYTLKSNNDALNNGAKQVFETLLAEANKQLSESGVNAEKLTIENYDDVLDAIIKDLDKDNVYKMAEKTVEEKVDAMGDDLYRQYLQTIADSIYDNYLKSIEDTIYTKYIEGNVDDICRMYLESQADTLYDTYLDSIKDDVINAYISNNADTFYRAYIDTIADSLYKNYLGQVISEANPGIDENSLNAAIESQLGALSDEQKEAIKDGAVNSLTDEQKTQIIEGSKASLTDEQKTQILAGAKAGLTADQKNQIIDGAFAKLTNEQKEAIKNGAKESLTDEQKALILAGAKEGLTDDEKSQILEGALKTLTDEQKAEIRLGAIEKGMQSDEVKQALEEAGEGVKKLTELKGSLDSYKEFYNGLKSYTDGVAKAEDGAKQLKDGTDTLKDGSNKLATGANDLYNGAATIDSKMPELIDGVTKLKNGSKELSDGIDRLNEEGIEKLTAVIDEDLEGITDRVKAILDVSDHYTTYSGKQGAMSGQVKFIFKTDSIE